MSIPGAASPLFLTSAAAADSAAAFQVDRSLRFNPSDSAYLSRTPSSAGNRKTWTWSGWIKKCGQGSYQKFFFGGSTSDEHGFRFENTDQLSVYRYSGSFTFQVKTTRVFRDPSAFFHLVVAYDSTQATASNRVKIYINGVQEDSFATSNYPAQNSEYGINNTVEQSVGRLSGAPTSEYFDGYLADVHFVDGQALAPTDFGELDANNNWNPKAFTGSYNAARTNLGGVTVSSYVSGPVNSTKPLSNCFGGTIGSGYQQGTTATAGNALTLDISSLNATVTNVRLNTFIGGSPGTLTVNGSNVSYSGGGDEQLVVAVNGQLNTIVWGYDNGNNYVYMRGIEVDFDDGNGYQLLEDGAGSPATENGFYLKFSDNSGNIALGFDSAPTTPDPDPKKGFDVITYTGTGSELNLGGLNFEPGLVWVKCKSDTSNHALYDIVRGVSNQLESQANTAEVNYPNSMRLFNADGFTVGTDGIVNTNGRTFVAWCWRAGGPAVAKTAGTINAEVSANADYGFSIVTYTGTGSAGTIEHGLDSAPKWILVKRRNTTAFWEVYHSGVGATKVLYLNNSDAATTTSNPFNDTSPTSSLFSVYNSSGTNASGSTYVAYCWSEVSGFSKFGSYSGSGSSGNTITTGFKPRFLILKRTSAAENWVIIDSERGDNLIFANLSNAEASSDVVDFTDDGFTLKQTGAASNASGSTYIYAAFADRPGNNFDVNNLVATAGADGTSGRAVSLYTGNDATQRKIGGVVYSKAVPTADGFRPGRAAADGFDGSLSTYVALNNYTFNLDVGSWGLSGTLEVYTGANMQYAVDGGSASSMTADGWTNVGNANAITTLTFTRTDGNYPYFYAIRLDGEYLIDGDGGPALQFQPDLVWVKNRDQTEKHVLVDSVRGVDKALYSSSASAEDSGSTYSDRFVSFNSDGFNVGSTHTTTNSDGDDFAAWSWSAGPNSNKTYTVKVVSDSGNKYRFDDFGSSAVTLDLQEGSTYIFDQSDSSNSGHPIRFGTSANGTDYTTGVTHTGTPGSAGAKTTLVLGTGVSTLYYSCLNHSGMGGQINTNSTAGASNFDGSIQSVVKASDTYGFSIMRYLGNASAGATVGHGLSKAPEWIIGKNRGGGDAWWVWFKAHSSDATKFLKLNTTNTESDTQYIANDTAPSDSVVTLGSDYGWNSSQSPGMIMYAWTSVSGYSKFGTYTGSSNLEITTGFKVQWLLLKSYAGDGFNWVIIDNARAANSSGVSRKLYPNLTGSEDSDSRASETKVEFTATGFKFLDQGAETNSSSRSYVYAAFAGKPPSNIIDSMLDSPSNYAADSGHNGGNYPTVNPLTSANISSTADGNLEVTTQSSNYGPVVSTMATSGSGKWYAEIKWDSGTHAEFGLCRADSTIVGQGHLYELTNSYVLDSYAGQIRYNGGSNGSASVSSGDLVRIAFDESAGQVEFFVNGSSVGTLDSSGATAGVPYVFAIADRDSATAGTFTFNFGASGSFDFDPPIGYSTLCAQNLPNPTIADGSTAFEAVLWTGDGTNNRKITTPFSPDFVWAKFRNQSYSHGLYDTVRGDDKRLVSHSTDAEGTVSLGMESDGFVVEGSSSYNDNNDSFVAWTWDAGSSTVTNQDGSLNSNVRANQTAGFSIVKYTAGSGSQNDTVGHGLNAVPELILLKRIDGSDPFVVFHKALSTGQYLELNSNTAAQTSASCFPTAHTSSVFGIGTDGRVNAGGNSYIAYCFTSVAGFSHFTTFEGTGSSDPVFVNCGFRPKWILRKNIDADKNWYLHDTTRDTFNICTKEFQPHNNSSEGDHDAMDILSNGFAMRTSNAQHNNSGSTHLVAAFAEHPFKTARAR